MTTATMKKSEVGDLRPSQLLLTFGVGAIVGAGIFSTGGSAAAGGAEHLGAGPAIIVSFLLMAPICALAGLCYAEFASMAPVSGSAYTYAYATLGELMAWIAQIREFLDSIKSRQRTTCDIEYGHRLSKGGLLANIAYRRFFRASSIRRVISNSSCLLNRGVWLICVR